MKRHHHDSSKRQIGLRFTENIAADVQDGIMAILQTREDGPVSFIQIKILKD